METYASQVDYQRIPGRISGCYSAGVKTIEEARERLKQDMGYYLSIGCQLVKCQIVIWCQDCSGSGRTLKPHKGKHRYGGHKESCYKPCLPCNGRNGSLLVEEIQMAL